MYQTRAPKRFLLPSLCLFSTWGSWEGARSGCQRLMQMITLLLRQKRWEGRFREVRLPCHGKRWDLLTEATANPHATSSTYISISIAFPLCRSFWPPFWWSAYCFHRPTHHLRVPHDIPPLCNAELLPLCFLFTPLTSPTVALLSLVCSHPFLI